MQHKEYWSTEDDQGGSTYQICKCLGCEAVRFRKEVWSTEDYNHNTGELEPSVTIYPAARRSERTPVDADAILMRLPESTGRPFAHTTWAP